MFPGGKKSNLTCPAVFRAIYDNHQWNPIITCVQKCTRMTSQQPWILFGPWLYLYLLAKLSCAISSRTMSHHPKRFKMETWKKILLRIFHPHTFFALVIAMFWMVQKFCYKTYDIYSEEACFQFVSKPESNGNTCTKFKYGIKFKLSTFCLL